MRPIEKGAAPYESISKYQDAEPYLEQRLGPYCSFCEMRINQALAVEHKESKHSGGALTDWDNLLLACTYCNSRKLEKIKKGELNKWLWPDKQNTFLAFSYQDGIPSVNEAYLKQLSEELLQRARTMFEGLALDYVPKMEDGGLKKGKYKDKRWKHRLEAFSLAKESRECWEKCKGTEFEDMQLMNIVNQAKSTGFFSVWMLAFEDEFKVRKELIRAFPGTDPGSFDEKGNPKKRDNSEL